MAKSKKDIIKNSLVTQLKLRKADTPFFLAMVDEYIYFYEKLTELKKIVKDEGIFIKTPYNNSGAVKQTVNPAMSEIENVNKQMLNILRDLKLTTDNIISEDEEDEL